MKQLNDCHVTRGSITSAQHQPDCEADKELVILECVALLKEYVYSEIHVLLCFRFYPVRLKRNFYSIVY